MTSPICTQREILAKIFPAIPEIPRYSPHIGVGLDMLAVLERCRPRRTAERVRPATAVDCRADLLDHAGGVWIRNIVDLDKVNTPVGIQLKQRVIPGLRPWFRRVDPVHIGIPGCYAARMSNS